MAATNKIRITGGEWRSRRLSFPDALGLRPTSDRIRQTLFNWLGQELDGQRCLDLFAGSGSLGFEALSRGATTVTMVESNPVAYRALLESARLLKTIKAQILHQDAIQFLSKNQQQYELIFLDPPFNQQWLEKLLPQMATWLAPGGLIYVESEQLMRELGGWNLLKHGKAGNVYYQLLKSAHET